MLSNFYPAQRLRAPKRRRSSELSLLQMVWRMGIRTLWATKGSWSRGLVLFNLILMRANHGA
nr:MAG TPA: hypothetical protein [Caudoviricetes sp.]